MILLYKDIKMGNEILKNVMEESNDSDNLFTIMNRFNEQVNAVENSDVGALGCGFIANQAQVLGFISGLPVTNFDQTVTLEKDTVYDFYKDLL